MTARGAVTPLSIAATLVAVVAGVASLVPGAGAAPAANASLELHRIGSFNTPTYVAQAPGEPKTLYVVEQPGRVVAMRNGRKLGRPFLDITDRVRFGPAESPSVEAGLFSIAFDPGYAKSGRFYVMYTGPRGNNYVDEFRRAGGKAVRAVARSRRTVLKIRHPFSDSHNGGQLQFGPDGRLWISSGDGGCCGDIHDQARSLGTQLGKLLRISPHTIKGGTAGADRTPRPVGSNPLVGVPGNDTIYSWGLRNVWRFSFDRLTGNLAIPDIGDIEHAREEINYLSPAAARGANFGWPEYEGFQLRNSSLPGPGPPLTPISSYSHRGGRCAITGGYVVRDHSLKRLYGRYVYADYCAGRIRSIAPPPLGANGLPATVGRVGDDRDEGLFLRFPSSFGEGLRGEIYVASITGPVYRLRHER